MVWSPAAAVRVPALELERVPARVLVLGRVPARVLVPELVLGRERLSVQGQGQGQLSAQARGPERQMQALAPGLPFVWVPVWVLPRPRVPGPGQQRALVVVLRAR